jgi:hypothetical protein
MEPGDGCSLLRPTWDIVVGAPSLGTRERRMATLVTRGGKEITFQTPSIDAIADHDTTGEAVTSVYGIGEAMLTIEETVSGFMQRLKIEDDFAPLTRLNGWPVWISGASVTTLRAPSPGEYAPTVRTLTQGVRETPDQARQALNAHGGSL